MRPKITKGSRMCDQHVSIADDVAGTFLPYTVSNFVIGIIIGLVIGTLVGVFIF